MDEFRPQSPGIHVKEGHEESDINVRGIMIFISVLVLSAVFTFVIAHFIMIWFEKGERAWFEPKLSPAEQQLTDQREGVSREPAEGKGSKTLKHPPDWYNRQVDDKTVQKIFAKPLLQYDDTTDMADFRDSLEGRLKHTGKDPNGAIHIPIDRAIDLLAQRGLPAVSGKFTQGPVMGPPEYESEQAMRRLAEQTTGAAGAQPGTNRPRPGAVKK